MFQNPGPQLDPCGYPLLIYLSSRTLLVDRIAVRLLKYLFDKLYRFLVQSHARRPFRILGHHAESNAPLTLGLQVL